MNYYGYTRATADIDLWIYDEPGNRKKLAASMSDLGIRESGLIEKMPLIAGFSEILLDNGIYIDLMKDLQFFKQEKFKECYALSEAFYIEDEVPVNVLHLNKLIEEKEKSKRPRDLEDAYQLKKIRNIR